MLHGAWMAFDGMDEPTSLPAAHGVAATAQQMIDTLASQEIAATYRASTRLECDEAKAIKVVQHYRHNRAKMTLELQKSPVAGVSWSIIGR